MSTPFLEVAARLRPRVVNRTREGIFAREIEGRGNLLGFAAGAGDRRPMERQASPAGERAAAMLRAGEFVACPSFEEQGLREQSGVACAHIHRVIGLAAACSAR